MVFKTQPIARATVLNYNGKRVLKKWESLKNFIGKKVRVTNEHPSVDPLSHTFTKGEEVSSTTLKKCPVADQLCADIPNHEKEGYSIGYEYEEIPESGIYEGQPYDAVRIVKNIDHVALVSLPRDANLVKVAGDSESGIEIQDGNCSVYIYPNYGIGIDTFQFNGIFKADVKMPELEEITAALEAEKVKTAKLAADNQKFQDTLLAIEKRTIDVAIDSMEKQYDIKPDTWEGKTPEFIKGARFGADAIAKRYEALSLSERAQGALTGAGQDGLDEGGYLDINRVVWKDGKLSLP